MRTLVLASVLLPAGAVPMAVAPGAPGPAAGSDFATDATVVLRSAELSLKGGDGVHVARVRNLLHGPVEVELRLGEHDNITAWPRLPHRMVIEAGAERAVATIEPVNPGRRGSFDLQLLAIPGEPGATHEDFDYRLPVDSADVPIGQGFGGRFSHEDVQNFYAIDFALPEGSPVLAARDGVVMQVVDDFDAAGLDRASYAHRSNHVRVLHADGSMAVYAHLRHAGARVEAGQPVSVGEVLGESGNTGFSSGPHLHFVVQVNTGMELQSVPIRLLGPDGPVEVPGR